MTKFVVVSPARGRSIDRNPAARKKAIQSASGKVLADLSHGTFASVDAAAAAKLAADGYDIVEHPDPDKLQIAGHALDVEAGRGLERGLSKLADLGWKQWVVQFAAPPENAWLQALERGGLRVAGKLGPYTFALEGDADDLGRVKGAPHVAFVAGYQPEWRISSNILRSTGRIRFASVQVAPASAADGVVEAIQAAGGAVERVWDEDESPSPDTRVIIAEIDRSALDALSSHPDVRWIDYQPPVYAPEDERSAQIVAGNLDGAAPPNTRPVTGYRAALAGLGFDGTGVVIAINDSGVDTNASTTPHPDLAGRFAFGPTSPGGGDIDGHGTHVAGIALGGGGGASDPGGFSLGQGMAPGARFGVVTSTSTASIAGFSQNAVQNGAHVMNCSWRVNPPGNAYSTADAVIDRAIRDGDGASAGMQPLAIVFSAGNSGSGASTLTKQTKNAIVVGNSLNARPGELWANDDIRGIHPSSSRGPAADNRLLPTVCAPGTDIVSARPTVDRDAVTPGIQRPRTAYSDTGGTTHPDHFATFGTSMASPHVAGLCALLIEWWRDRTGGRTPSPAMLKALIVNGAIDCAGGPDGAGGTLANIPNPQQGWGRANLRNIVLTTPDVRRGPKLFVDQRHAFTANGQVFSLRVAVADPTIPLRVTLAWTDAPGNPAAAQMLVNDLDLELVSVATGTVFRGEGGSGTGFAGGFSVANGPRDSRNNLECVYIQAPAGEYDVRVRATSVTTNARPPHDANAWQDFALVIDNAERAASAPAGIVTLIDRSGSMVHAGYVNVTRTSARAFVDRLRVGDAAGVVSFGSDARREFPAAGAALTITGAAQRDQARAAIGDIAFGGMTHMGPAITMGASMLSGVSGSRGMALFSDGYDNGSPSALSAVASLPAGLPVYTCAMGPLSDQALLQQIASTTSGRYYFMPTIDDLFEIHNYISGSLTGDSLVANDSAMASSSRVEAWVDGTCKRATFTVAWADPELRFAAREPRGPADIEVRLRAPNGKLVHHQAAHVHRTVGNGYVVFRVDEPAAGRWYMEVSTARASHTRYTAAAFVDSNLRLLVRPLTNRLKVKLPWSATATALLGDRVLADMRVVSNIRRPAFDADDILARHGDLARTVKLSDAMPPHAARLAAIREALGAAGKKDPFTFSTSRLTWAVEDARGVARLEDELDVEAARAPAVAAVMHSLNSKVNLLPPAAAALLPANPSLRAGLAIARFVPQRAGSHNVMVSVRGTVPGSREPFVRREMVSFVAE